VTALVKKSFIAGILVSLILISSITGLQVVLVTDANMIPIPWIKINSPLSSVIYQNTTVVLEVVVGNQDITNPVTNITYILDSGPIKEIGNITKSPEYHFLDYPVADFSANTLLENLTPGNHSLTVFAAKQFGPGRGFEVDFAVIAPSLTSPTHRTSSNSNPAITTVSLLAISVAAMIAVALLSLVYLKRRNKNKLTNIQ
jgi:hypothetical protein